MLITEVKIRKTFTEGTLKAIVSITIDNSLTFHEIKAIQDIVQMNDFYLFVISLKSSIMFLICNI